MTDLPNDVEQLKAMLLQLQAENQAKDEQLKITQQESLAKDEQLKAKQEENTELQNKLDLLIEQLNLSKSKRFSASSEKTPKGTFNEAEQQHALPKLTPKAVPNLKAVNLYPKNLNE